MSAALCRFSLAVVSGLGGLLAAPGQQQPAGGQLPATPRQPGFLPTQSPGALQQNPAGQAPGIESDGFTPVWVAPTQPGFSGFPVFPSRLSGYGNYPLPVDPNAAAGSQGPGNPATGMLPGLFPLPPAEPEPPGWPAWIRSQAKEPLPFAEDVALLVRNGDRVWFRSTTDEPFVPLFFHSKFASLPIRGEVEVRQAGEFELLLHNSTRIQARGPTAVRLGTMDEKSVEVIVPTFSWMRIQSYGRAHTIELPDGSKLLIEPPPEPAEGADAGAAAASMFAALLGLPPPAAPGALPAMVELQRVDEPGWYTGRATITNLGGRAVTWRHAFGESVIEPSQRVTFFLSRPAAPTPAELVAGNTVVKQRGGNVTCRSTTATEVQWCGARIALPPGGEVTFESLQGDGFPAPPPRTANAPPR